ncbi:hypothetical protein ACH5RR_002861 [Cinchona calisaya]|uniref:Uncharacterized protein n=1 Tax=Cinchona calisaya TaxID=153742 RepID=A0ABD3AT56_9GENT
MMEDTQQIVSSRMEDITTDTIANRDKSDREDEPETTITMTKLKATFAQQLDKINTYKDCLINNSSSLIIDLNPSLAITLEESMIPSSDEEVSFIPLTFEDKARRSSLLVRTCFEKPPSAKMTLSRKVSEGPKELPSCASKRQTMDKPKKKHKSKQSMALEFEENTLYVPSPAKIPRGLQGWRCSDFKKTTSVDPFSYGARK